LTYENLGPLGGPNSGTKAVWNNGEHGAVLGGVLGPYPGSCCQDQKALQCHGLRGKGVFRGGKGAEETWATRRNIMAAYNL